jgi:aryl-alcohol dehydrogenase-like predicted oxidoreductase
MHVRRRPFGRTGRDVSEIGFGCGGYWGYAVFPERDARAILDAALERGVDLIDTGPNYSNGNAEVRTGRLLAGRWDGLVVGTKVGSRRTPGGGVVKDFSPAGMQASLEQSLRNLRTDHVPLVQLHSPTVAELTNEATLATLLAWKRRGLVSWLGVSSGPREVTRALELGVFDCVMLTHNLLRPAPSAAVIEQAARAGVAVIAKSPLGQALYSRSFLRVRSLSQLWYLARTLRHGPGPLLRARRFGFLNDVAGWRATDIALRYVLDDPRITATVIGTTKAPHLIENLEVSNRPSLPAPLRERIERTA